VRKALAVYGPTKLERLQAVKRRYDPEDLLRVNHNIRLRRERADLGARVQSGKVPP
jgi:hypothetical protein